MGLVLHPGSGSDSNYGKLKSACNLCLGTEGHCKWCGCRLNWFNGKPIEYQSGNYHHCPYRNKNRERRLLTLSQDLIVNHDYAGLVPHLSTQEYESLKRSIKENGQFFPIIVNSHNVILDGHHRFKICRELGIKPIISVKNFASPDHEKLFIYECEQRRHLTRYQKIVTRVRCPGY